MANNLEKVEELIQLKWFHQLDQGRASLCTSRTIFFLATVRDALNKELLEACISTWTAAN